MTGNRIEGMPAVTVLRSTLAAVGGDVSAALVLEWLRALGATSPGGVRRSVSTLATDLFISHKAARGAVDRLVDAGLVHRHVPDSMDRTAHLEAVPA